MPDTIFQVYDFILISYKVHCRLADTFYIIHWFWLPFHCPPGLEGSVRHNELRRGFGYDVVSKQRRRCRCAYSREEHASLLLVLGPHRCRVIKVLWARDLVMTENVYNVSLITFLIQKVTIVCVQKVLRKILQELNITAVNF